MSCSKKSNPWRCMIALCFLAIGLLYSSLSAQYEIPRSCFDIAGGVTSSQSYQLVGSCGEVAVGVASSSNYILTSGFLAFGLEAVGIDDLNGNSNLPRTYALSQNYPNPFNPSTTIQFDIPHTADKDIPVRLDVFDIRGRLIRTLIEEKMVSGTYKVYWDGRSSRGERMGSGIYIYRLAAGNFVSIRKMVLVK